MYLKWEEDHFGPGELKRWDLNLVDDEDHLIGFFRNFKEPKRTWVPVRAFVSGKEVKMWNLTLEEAKAVVEAMIRLEG